MTVPARQRPVPVPRPGARRRPTSAGSTSWRSAAPGCRASPGCCSARGVVVSGCDTVDGPASAALRRDGAVVEVGHDAAHLDDVDTVVVSSAIRDDNVELAAARAGGLRVLHRSQALASLMGDARRVAVAGANGKTTTTSMLVVALAASGADPSFASGGEIRQLGTNAALGAGPDFVVEADESDGSFLAYRPACRRRDERPARPPRLLRHGRGGGTGLCHVRRLGRRGRAARRVLGRRRLTPPGPRGRGGGPRRAHLRVRRGSRPAGPRHPGRGARHRVGAAPRRRRPHPAARRARAAQRPRRGCRVPRRRRRPARRPGCRARWPRGVHRSPAALRGEGRGGRRHRRRRLRPQPAQGGGGGRHGGRARPPGRRWLPARRLPATPVQPHPRLRRAVRPGAGPRRPGRAPGGVRRPGGPARGRRLGAHRRPAVRAAGGAQRRRRALPRAGRGGGGRAVPSRRPRPDRGGG